jgi:hypothetical protein
MTQPYDDSPADRSESFGDGRVDAAVARLEELPRRPVSEHVEIFDDIHGRLRAALEDAGDDPADDRSA